MYYWSCMALSIGSTKFKTTLTILKQDVFQIREKSREWAVLKKYRGMWLTLEEIEDISEKVFAFVSPNIRFPNKLKNSQEHTLCPY